MIDQTIDPLQGLKQAPATDVKKHGWRGIMRAVADEGRILITNHQTPEAVILSTSEYSAMVAAIQSAQSRVPDVLEDLRHRFDERLAALEVQDAAQQLASVFAGPARLNGKLKADETY